MPLKNGFQDRENEISSRHLLDEITQMKRHIRYLLDCCENMPAGGGPEIVDFIISVGDGDDHGPIPVTDASATNEPIAYALFTVAGPDAEYVTPVSGSHFFSFVPTQGVYIHDIAALDGQQARILIWKGINNHWTPPGD